MTQKFTLVLFGFLILAGGCSLVKQAGLDDTRERVEGLEAANRELHIQVSILEDRIALLELEIVPPPEPEPPQPAAKAGSIQDRIRAVCKAEGFKQCENLIKLARCESSLNPNAKNITRRERSYGLFQINLKAHKNVTIKQATDVEWSTRWTINQIRKQGGSYRDWQVCARRIGLRR